MQNLESKDREIHGIPLDRIDPDSFVLRTDLGDVSQLAESIRLLGLLEPLVVRASPSASRYQLLAGHRRYRALLSIGAKKARCTILHASDKDAYLIALSENVQRKSLNPIEEAMAYSNYVHKKGWGGISELAKNIGRSAAYVHTLIRLLDLPLDVQEMVAKGEIRPFVAAELIGVKDPIRLRKIIEEVKVKKPSMRQLRSTIRSRGDFFDLPQRAYLKAIEDMIVSARNCMINFDISIGKLDENSEYYRRSVEFRYRLHQFIDELVNERARIRDELKLFAELP